MNVHKNARLTPQGRALLVHRIHTGGWPDAATAAGTPHEPRFAGWLLQHPFEWEH
ncbi:MAG TPA: leucine zipper domain-containing protein [Nitrococcus sp.]|nr:leucine zipper domain-containing protein [Nitrococcus sp.]